jgi:succinyl-diaminopimelate desuccinylase
MARVEFCFIRDAFRLDEGDALVSAFQSAHRTLSGKPLTTGPKPFCDDGNSFWGIRQLPAITHGPRAGGQHTLKEWMSIDDMLRVAHLYALTAVTYCAR